MSKVSFSIIITCHNQRAFIQEAVRSALAQSYPAKEVIVVDDASLDGSLDLLRQYGDGITLIEAEKNVGGSRARNLGVSRARGDFLVFLDGDDVLLSWAVELYARAIAVKQPAIILGTILYFKGQTVKGSSLYFRTTTPEENYDALPKAIGIVEYDRLMDRDRGFRANVSAMVIQRETFLEVGGWTEEIFPAEDFDLLLKLGYSGRTIQIDYPPTVCYRVHDGNTMLQVARCTTFLCKVSGRAKSGAYTVDGRGRFGAYAVLGGAVLFWFKRAIRARCYGVAFELLHVGWPMIFATALRQLRVRIIGRAPIEVLPGL